VAPEGKFSERDGHDFLVDKKLANKSIIYVTVGKFDCSRHRISGNPVSNFTLRFFKETGLLAILLLASFWQTKMLFQFLVQFSFF
jgi:hypothetical protein